jgi:hypothetical protein
MIDFYRTSFAMVTVGALLAATPAKAQDQETQRCHTTEFTRALEDTDPHYLASRAEALEQMARWEAEHPDGGERAVLTIPVVVHVVYKTSVQNISDAQILSQIDVLNEDYRKLNADVANLPSAFSSFAADCEIEFQLAVRDPDDLPTNGITRTETTASGFSGDEVKSSAQGGKDPWPASRYMNIWVCNLTGGLLGYTYPPGVGPSIDGLVIGYRYFGRVGTLSSVYNKGRTTTHEIGHYLNLEHLWGTGAANANCNADDGVSDTPKQDSENFGCPQFPLVSCNNGPNGDMFMNYMDYTNDACMFFFTNGQKTRMRAALQGSRASLLSSDALTPTVPGVAELGMTMLQMYPNPADREVTLVLAERIGPCTVRVIDGVGRTVETGTHPDSERIVIDLSQLASGSYTVEAIGTTGRARQRLIITQ